VSDGLERIANAAAAESVPRSGPWIACRIGGIEACTVRIDTEKDGDVLAG
jgi:hypothetical protein